MQQTIKIPPSFLSTLLNVTCNYLDIDLNHLYEKDRRERIKFARWMVWEIMVACRNFTFTDCSKIFGEHDHTTVLNGIDKLELDLQNKVFFAEVYQKVLSTMKVDFETIKKFRIERKEKIAFVRKDREIKRRLKLTKSGAKYGV